VHLQSDLIGGEIFGWGGLIRRVSSLERNNLVAFYYINTPLKSNLTGVWPYKRGVLSWAGQFSSILLYRYTSKSLFDHTNLNLPVTILKNHVLLFKLILIQKMFWLVNSHKSLSKFFVNLDGFYSVKVHQSSLTKFLMQVYTIKELCQRKFRPSFWWKTLCKRALKSDLRSVALKSDLRSVAFGGNGLIIRGQLY